MSADGERMLDLLRRAIPVTRALIAGVDRDQWDAPTPCEEMTVLGIVEHLVGGLHQFGDVAAGREVDITDVPSLDGDRALEVFDATAEEMLALWARPEVAEGEYQMPWGPTPGVTLLAFMVMEEVVHGWDLARAVGRAAAYDEDLAEAALAMAQEHDDPTIRVPGMFGPEVPVPADAPVMDRLAAFLGRHPDWTPHGIETEIVELEPETVAAVHGEVPVEGLPEFFGAAFTAAAAAIEAAGLTITGPPIGYYPAMPTDVVIVEAGFPTSGPIETTGDVRALTLPGGRAVVTTHVGPYDTMEATYAALQTWMAAAGLTPAAGMWECYLSDPEVEPDPSTWRTRIVWPVKS